MATEREPERPSGNGVDKDAEERLVHEEEMHASLREVLEFEHEEEAAELEQARDALPKAPEPAPHIDVDAQPKAHTVRQDTTSRSQKRPEEPSVHEPTAHKARPASAEPRRRAHARRRGFRRLNPVFLLRAGIDAAGELRLGIRRAGRDARDDLLEAARRARDCFRG